MQKSPAQATHNTTPMLLHPSRRTCTPSCRIYKQSVVRSLCCPRTVSHTPESYSCRSCFTGTRLVEYHRPSPPWISTTPHIITQHLPFHPNDRFIFRIFRIFHSISTHSPGRIWTLPAHQCQHPTIPHCSQSQPIDWCHHHWSWNSRITSRNSSPRPT